MGKKTKKKEQPSFTPYQTKKEKTARIKYITERINSLFDEMSGWINGTGYSLKRINTNVDDVKLPAAEIYSDKRKILSVLPAGLWAFGVNLRLDIKSNREEHILFDTAEISEPPDWELISKIPKPDSRPLTKMIFRNMLKRNDSVLRLVKLK